MTSRFPTAAEFASFPPPNYIDPETRLPLALAICIPMSVLVTVAISARFYSRTVLVRALGLDDWIMLLAAVSGYTKSALLINILLTSPDNVYRKQYHGDSLYATAIPDGLPFV